MEYLRKEYRDYLEAKTKGKSFSSFNPRKAHAFNSLTSQISPFLKSNSKILEVGFGSGYCLSLLEEAGHQTFGAEIADYTLDYAEKLFAEKELVPRLVRGDGFNLPFADRSFDLVFNVGTIEHFDWEDQKKFIGEMTRTSKDLVLLSTPNDHLDSRYQAFKKTEHYIPETENITDLNQVAREHGLTPIKSGGFHVSMNADEKSPLEFELSMSDQERARLGFLKYTLAKKD